MNHISSFAIRIAFGLSALVLAGCSTASIRSSAKPVARDVALSNVFVGPFSLWMDTRVALERATAEGFTFMPQTTATPRGTVFKDLWLERHVEVDEGPGPAGVSTPRKTRLMYESVMLESAYGAIVTISYSPAVSSEQAAMDLINRYLAAAQGWRKVETPRGNLRYVRSVDGLETGSIEHFGGAILQIKLRDLSYPTEMFRQGN